MRCHWLKKRSLRQNDRFNRFNSKLSIGGKNSRHDVNRQFATAISRMKTSACTINSWPEEIFPDRFPAAVGTQKPPFFRRSQCRRDDSRAHRFTRPTVSRDSTKNGNYTRRRIPLMNVQFVLESNRRADWFSYHGFSRNVCVNFTRTACGEISASPLAN